MPKLSRYTVIKDWVEGYVGHEVWGVEIVADPAVPYSYAVRATDYTSELMYFIVWLHPDEQAVEEAEEVEFTYWPPVQDAFHR